MKGENRKYRLFGLINPVDLLVLLTLLAVAAGLVWKLGASKITDAGEKVKLTYTVRARALHGRMQDEIKRQLEREPQLFTSEGFVADAYVTGVVFEESVSQIVLADGQLVNAADPTRVDAIFTVEALVPKNAAPLTVGTQVIRAGANHYLKTRLVEYLGGIETVMLDE